MSVIKIKQIAELFGLDSTKKIIREEVTRLTAPGENYGSLILRVDLTIETSDGTEEIHAVAKMVPPNEFLQQVFNTKVTFLNEIAFYKTILPLLQDFQEENGITGVDFAPRYYGSRLNNGVVDNDSALVLENLSYENYIGIEKSQGMDLEASKLILEDLAHLHGLTLGLKLKKPEVFDKEIKPYLNCRQVDKKHHELMKSDLNCVIDQIPELKSLRERILEGFDKQVVLQEPREPFATVVHDDCWTNNTMVKFDGTKAVKTKLVDYQLCRYGSPGRDIVFFLFSSVQTNVLVNHYDDLLQYYYDKFLKVLKQLKCGAEDFSFEALLKDIEHEAKYTQFAHVAFMMIPIFAQRTNVIDISEFRPEDMGNIAKNVSDLHKKKFIFVVEQFLQRNWI